MQLELPVKTQKPEVTTGDVERLCKRLTEKGWVFARELREQYHYNDRELRAIASHSNGRIISGQKGYRVLDRTASIEEVDHAASWLESQAKEMLKRATSIRTRYHKFNR